MLCNQVCPCKPKSGMGIFFLFEKELGQTQVPRCACSSFNKRLLPSLGSWWESRKGCISLTAEEVGDEVIFIVIKVMKWYLLLGKWWSDIYCDGSDEVISIVIKVMNRMNFLRTYENPPHDLQQELKVFSKLHNVWDGFFVIIIIDVSIIIVIVMKIIIKVSLDGDVGHYMRVLFFVIFLAPVVICLILMLRVIINFIMMLIAMPPTMMTMSFTRCMSFALSSCQGDHDGVLLRSIFYG